MAELEKLLQQSAALHHHLCPRQVLGVRIGMYASQLLALNLPQSDKRLFTFVESDGCFADGVAVATGCWLGRRTMRLVNYGKVAATVVDTHTRQAFRIWPNPCARSHAVRYAPHAASRWHAQLDGYQVMPTDELLVAQRIRLTVDLERIIGRPGLRVLCSICGEEIMNEREVLLHGQPLCRACAGDSYYTQLGEVPDA
jgi:formylmethanofuran dehydrogenase subunit E